MKFFSYLRVELNRIFHSKVVYLIMILTMLCPMAGYKLYNDGMLNETLCGKFIGNPSIAGAVGGGILFAILTLLEFNRVHKYEIEELTNSIVSPLVLNVGRLLTMGIAATVTVSITSALYYPYTVIKMGKVFDGYTYLNSFFLLMLPSVLLSILAASALYQIFYRIDLSMAAFILLMLPSLIEGLPIGNILNWIKPSVPALSDYFSNTQIFRLMKHNRLFWFLIFGSLWLIGLLSVRCYGKRIFSSMLYNSRKVYIPLIAVAMIGGGCYAFINQPDVFLVSKEGILEIINNDSKDGSDKVNKEIQLLNSDLKILFDGSKGSLSGKAVYSLQNLSNSEQECRFTINPGYAIHQIIVNDKKVTFKKLKDIRNNIIFNVPKEKNIRLTIEYEGRPKVLYFLSDFMLDTNISDKYIDLNKDFIPNIKVANSKNNSEFTCQLTMPAGLMPVVNPAQEDESGEAIANLTGDTTLLLEDGYKKTWLVHLKGTRLSLMAGDYVMKQLGNEEMPIKFYYSSKHEDTMKNMSAEKVMKDTIDYCINHYGKLNNVSKNSPLKIVEKTALFPGGLALPNYSTMGEFCFNDENLSDKSKGASAAEILAHELAHQWWGVHTVGSGGNNRNWSAEGLAVYTTYRVAKKTHGEEYAKKNYVDIWKARVKENNNNFYTRHPEYLKILPQRYVRDIDGSDRVLRQYSKLPLQILKASKLVGGEDKMDKILVELYKNKSKTRITWQDFLNACELKGEELNLE
ncbi:M1 family metallopeptidase [Clostridium botulinum]|uniref:Putative membrane protein n=2 Tax=Clostridium botulinum TaxID=1491 RepID=A7GF75_CLOBL|nr:putative membrane protein [Clostridium botulinum F str. Langeland]ADF99838.1 putative membrane protein [Clostridium botulinum F str. 230613]NFF56139.1 M1 family metallopeptidase [Clostridium botulinum]NEZ51495.1 M1 family metallopeptidase [Clostridium botulinum F str. Langeland]NFL11561.1 M1 family metallopeptidase [Clostridium botulinum]